MSHLLQWYQRHKEQVLSWRTLWLVPEDDVALAFNKPEFTGTHGLKYPQMTNQRDNTMAI